MARFSWTSDRIREALGLAESDFASRGYVGVSTDTRTIRPGDLFVALKGERFDGLDFVGAAAQSGAAGAVVERRLEVVPEGFEVFVVEDALTALSRLAAVRRAALNPRVIAVTGTSGKTTTRELIAAALDEKVYSSPGNYNNLVGAPLAILGAPEDSDPWVLELASNQPGEIGRLAMVSEPNYAVITSVSEGHLEGLGDLEGVLREKLELLDSLRPGGLALVADEPPGLAEEARRRTSEVVTVGLGAAADERPEGWAAVSDGVTWTWRGVDFRLPGHGAHLVHDAMFALVLAQRLGADLEEVAIRIAEARPLSLRGEVRRLGELTLLVDCYNANPASFRAAIAALSALAAGRRRAVLAGTMLELGDRSAALHERVLGWMADEGIELIAATGEFAEVSGRLADVLGDRLIAESELDAAYPKLAARLGGDEAVLIKASRGMKFERAIPLFERDFGGDRSTRMSGTES